MNNWQYYGLFLNEESRNRLIKFLTKNGLKYFIKNFTKIYIDHCTLMHVSQREELVEIIFNKNLNKKFNITIVAVGFSDKCMAFKVRRTEIVNFCKNGNPHITIGTFKDGKPVDSNDIIKWTPLEEPIEVQTILKRV